MKPLSNNSLSTLSNSSSFSVKTAEGATSQLYVWWQPQLLSIILVVLFLTIFSVIIFFKVKKVKPNETPNTVALFAEKYVNFIDDTFNGLTSGNIEKPRPYFFALITFLLLGNTIGVFGFDPISSSYSVALTLGLISWAGIYVTGILFQRWYFFRRYLFNPIELFGQFAPLISVSLRMFGNIIGGSVLIFLFYFATGTIWAYIPVIGKFNLLGALLAPPLHIYLDLFSGAIQAFVFSLLTLLYWTNETNVPIKMQERIIKKQKKLQKRLEYAKTHEE